MTETHCGDQNDGTAVAVGLTGPSLGRALRVAVLMAALCVGSASEPELLSCQETRVDVPSDPSRIKPGDTVRLRLAGAQLVEAVFQGWDADVMRLQLYGVEQEWPVSVFDMTWLEVHTERTRREGLRHYAVLGAATGLFVGAGVGLGLHAIGVTKDPDGPAEQIMAHTLRGAGLGTVAGFLMGGYLGGRHPGAGWISLALPAPGR